MSLRTRCFLLISILFALSMILSTVVTNMEVRSSLEKAKEKIDAQIVANDREIQKNIVTYIDINTKGIATRLDTVLSSVQNIGWLNQRFAPSLYNYETRDWESAARLLLMNESLDFVQSINEGELTSLIALRPPFFQEFLRLPVDDFLSVVIKMKGDQLEAFIGIPFWSNQAIPMGADLSTSKKIENRRSDADDWLLFTVDQLLAMDTENLKDKVVVPQGPLRDEVTEEGIIAYKGVIAETIESIRLAKAKLLEKPDFIRVLQTPAERDAWAQEKAASLLKQKTLSLYNLFKKAGERLKRARIRNWGDRHEQNRMVWELGALTGSGIWNYNPLDKFAPKGIVSLLRGEIVVDGRIRWAKGFLTEDTYFANPSLLQEACVPEPVKGERTECVAGKLQLFDEDPLQGIYLGKSLFLTDWTTGNKEPRRGSLTVGINIMPLLQDLALASPDDILFVNKAGKNILFDSRGNVRTLPRITPERAKQMVRQKTGTLKNIADKEYFFTHIHSLEAERGSIFIVQVRANVFSMLKQLNDQAALLINQVTWQHVLASLIALIVTLFVLSHILKHVIRPIQELALATKQIGAGKYSSVHISEAGKKRKDEIGLLCRSFDQMTKEMQQAEEVRGILDKVVSKEVAAKILKEGVKLGGEVREVTVLFCDIRHFVKITETMSPTLVLDMLNDCLTLISRVIDEHEGVIDKYIGDEVMALFGAPLDTKDAALQAVLCATSIRSVMREWNAQRSLRQLPILPVGIGIHTASVIAGNIGAENHLSYTVLGHGVNLASRICEQAGEMEVLITRETLEAPHVKDKIEAEPLGLITPRGLSTPVEIFRVL